MFIYIALNNYMFTQISLIIIIIILIMIIILIKIIINHNTLQSAMMKRTISFLDFVYMSFLYAILHKENVHMRHSIKSVFETGVLFEKILMSV